MRVFYHLGDYISFRQSGMEYIACLRLLGHSVTTSTEELGHADVAILHDEPVNIAPLYARHPVLHTVPSVAFCVWENETLPAEYVPPLQSVDEIWTPSAFSQRSFEQHFPHVRVLPHVVKRHAPTTADLAFARGLLERHGKAFCFFSVVDSVNPRKNVEGLLGAFSALRELAGMELRLVLKQYRLDFDYSGLPGVISIGGNLTLGQMAALYISTDAYVSAHHAEGWGLGMSEAMAYGKPVIATAYSGNMEYMTEENSFPVPYKMEPVSLLMCERIPLFRPDMFWAQIDRDALIATMKRVAAGRAPAGLAREAAAITHRFGPQKVAGKMQSLLDTLLRRLSVSPGIRREQ